MQKNKDLIKKRFTILKDFFNRGVNSEYQMIWEKDKLTQAWKK